MSTIPIPATDEVREDSDPQSRGLQRIVNEYILKREPAFQRCVELRQKVVSNSKPFLSSHLTKQNRDGLTLAGMSTSRSCKKAQTTRETKEPGYSTK
jgi:hypothetical protein